MAVVKILIIPGSLRTGSHNARLAAAAMRELALANIDVTQISLADYTLPLYDADLEQARGVPKPALDLKRLIGIHHGIFIASPEYNASVSPLLKNTIDWVSRVRERGEDPLAVFRGRAFALGAASPSKYGGMRGLIALRQVLELGCGANVIPEQIAISFADRAYDDNDHLKDERDRTQFQATISALVTAAQRFTEQERGR